MGSTAKKATAAKKTKAHGTPKATPKSKVVTKPKPKATAQPEPQESQVVVIPVRRGLPKRSRKPARKIVVTDLSRPRPAYIYVAAPNLDQHEAVRARRRRRRVRNLTVSTAFLTMLLLGGGVFYTWYTDKHAHGLIPVAAAATVPSVQPITPRQPAKNAQESVAETSFSTPIHRGDTASLYIQTLPYSVCSIVVTYGTVQDKQPALNAATADSFGSTGWNWTPPNDVPSGDWPVNVTCAYGGKTAVLMEKLSIIG